MPAEMSRPSALALLALVGCGEPAGKVPLAGLDQAGVAPMALAEGTELSFAIVAARWESRATTRFALDIELLRAEQPVGSMRCDRFVMKGARSGSLDYHDRECAIRVPAGGATAIRAKLASASQPKLEGLAIDVRRH